MDNHGFTLIEMLFSVFIIAIIVSLITYNVVYEVRRSELSNSQLQIEGSLELARSCAIANQTMSSVTFGRHQLAIECVDSNQTVAFDNVEITTNFPNNVATFNSSGIVNQAATIDICNPSGCEQLTIGVGRSDVNVK